MMAMYEKLKNPAVALSICQKPKEALMSTEEGFAGEVKASRQRTKASFFPVIM